MLLEQYSELIFHLSSQWLPGRRVVLEQSSVKELLLHQFLVIVHVLDV